MKGKTLKRLFAWLLSAALLAACVPTAFAEGVSPAGEATQGEASEATIPADGPAATADSAACDHKPVPKTIWVPTGEYETTEDGHIAKKAGFNALFCGECGEELSREPLAGVQPPETELTPEAHTFVDGVCTVCGYEETVEGEDEPVTLELNGEEDEIVEDAADGEEDETVGEPVEGEQDETVEETADGEEDETVDAELDDILGGASSVSANAGEEDEDEAVAFTLGVGNMVKIDGLDGLINGISADEPMTVAEEPCEHVFSSEGKCTKCGALCPHEQTSVYYHVENRRHTPVDAMTHNYTYDLYERKTCKVCGMQVADDCVAKDYTELQEHPFSSEGKCYICGYELKCSHEAAYDSIRMEQEAYDSRNVSVLVAHDATTHTFRAKMQKYCPTCHSYFGDSWYTDGNETVTFKHMIDDTGECVYCGFTGEKCAHTNKRTRYETSRTKGSAVCIDEKYHSVSCVKIENIYCNDCGDYLGQNQIGKAEVMVEAHSFNDSTLCCEICGYKKSCAHENTYVERFLIPVAKITANDEYTHSGLMQVKESTYCDDCGELLRVSLEEAQNVTVEHTMAYPEDGTQFTECSECGYRKLMTACTHQNKHTETIYLGKQGVTSNGAEGHTVKFAMSVERTSCDECGVSLSEKLLQENCEVKSSHEFSNGKCYECGYVNACKHDGALRILPDPINVRDAKDNGDGTHTYLADVYTYTTCLKCGEVSVTVERNKAVTEAHFMRSGVCIDCHFKDPDAPDSPYITGTVVNPSTPPAQDTGSDSGSSGGSSGSTRPSGGNGGYGGGTAALPVEPLATPEPPATASDELVVSVIAITSEMTEDPSATIEIVGAEELMTDAEFQRFDKLSLTEQIMVMLSVAGATEDITSTLPPSATLLTAGAQTLIAEITGRIETSAESPFQFEIDEVTVKGMLCKRVTITFEVTKNGVKTLTTRSFYFDPMLGEWVAMDAPAVA